MQDKVLLYIRPGTSRQEINQIDERNMSKDNCTTSTPQAMFKKARNSLMSTRESWVCTWKDTSQLYCFCINIYSFQKMINLS